ncbi:imidazole glycerol phosphate synthase subunit HisH [Olivibacter sp. SDN3]|uniref:imidazole glycerol phosphate synthase subunit HisH n=1 Tax=Olivibacter sp. SDN3 TaxID=2764720 RepID=UPI0016511683|nr:imidazole glycerol phosphate synthase subunit HisH [Olivibacter sp. SDN3]QNL49945.1 imidazole glycerol phosphate synthase subunit HisH [Olivibacter sp. SDN3]
MIGIINYGAGNIFSLTAALDRLNLKHGMVNVEDNMDVYSHIIIPGVGHAGAAMKKLQESGLVETIKTLKQPVLGICVGMQLLTGFSEEGNTDLLDIMDISTLHFANRVSLKVPHMGWNRVHTNRSSPLFQDIDHGAYFYFVHSYFIEYNPTFTLAYTNYGIKYSSAIQHRNFYGVQFHPEKSGQAGEQLLRNFSTI